MVLNDGLFDNMSAEKWEETVSVKAQICKNLDIFTRNYCPGLEHFVMWSSVSALFGNAGQTNYGFANGSMENTCMTRKADGLSGLAIQWGLIGGVGVGVKIGMTEETNNNKQYEFAPLHIDSCLQALHLHLLSSTVGVATCYLRSETDEAATALQGASVSLLQRIAHVLGVDQAKVRPADTLAVLGMDSLQGVELVGMLKREGHSFTTAELQQMTWAELVAQIGE
jgi:fatty acid synthase, animal type